jgi:PAS domain S-box-containing protein
LDRIERPQAEAALRESVHFTRSILNSLTTHIAVLDEHGVIVAVNEAWSRFARANEGASSTAYLGTNYLAVCEQCLRRGADETAAAALRGLRAVMDGAQEQFTLEYPCHSPDEQRWFSLQATRFAGEGPVRLVVAHENITRRKLAEEALRQSEERYRSVVEDQTEVIGRFNADGTFTFVNDVFCRFFGKTRHELLDGTWRPRALAEDVPRVEQELRAMSPAHPVVVIENRVYSGSGQVRWMQFVNRGFYDTQGRLVEIQGVGRDVTDRKQIEASLRESEAAARGRADELAAMLAATPAITFLAHDRECRRMSSSRAALRLLRLPDGANSSKSAPPGERPETFRAMKNGRELRPEELPVQLAVATGQAVKNFELTLAFHDGTARDIVGDAVPLFDAEGKVRGAVGAFLDITDRKQAEQALRDLSGRLLRSQDEERRRIARELHDTTAQGLAALLMNLSLVKASAPGMNDKTRQILADTVSLAEQSTRELRTVSYLLHPPMLDELGLAGAMRDYADGFARRSGLRVDLELPPDLEGLPRDTALALFRVMQEALANVRRHSGSRTASIRLARTATELQLEVRDQGQGMAAARKLSAGDPPGGGLGVGVPGMRERMRQLGGRLEIESNNRGTCVIAIAPVTGKAPAQLQP